ncbi:hypothetical protein U1Q18_051189 [Sarracenia purpurea var. burkii]
MFELFERQATSSWALQARSDVRQIPKPLFRAHISLNSTARNIGHRIRPTDVLHDHLPITFGSTEGEGKQDLFFGAHAVSRSASGKKASAV